MSAASVSRIDVTITCECGESNEIDDVKDGEHTSVPCDGCTRRVGVWVDVRVTASQAARQQAFDAAYEANQALVDAQRSDGFHEKLKCPECGRYIAGRTPRGGDGSALRLYAHDVTDAPGHARCKGSGLVIEPSIGATS